MPSVVATKDQDAMQPDQAGVIARERRPPIDAERFAVGSRRRALDRLRMGFYGGTRGPVLITGEPGSGKSWLVRRFIEGLPAVWRSAEVELTPALGGLEMLRLLGDDLGLEMPDRLGAARLMLRGGLGDDTAEGRSWALIIDAAERAAADAWAEILVLSNRLGRAGGFAAIILLARTEFARELAAQRRNGWSNRLGLHIHLPPLDLDEARQLLVTEGGITEPELEILHRDALGNPRAMLRIAEARRPAPWPVPARSSATVRIAASSPHARPALPDEPPGAESIAAGIGVPASEDDSDSSRLSALIPSKPPIRFEDGLVEVGWDGDLEAEATRSEAVPSDPEAGPPGESDPSEELVEDRYAALQAWAEWSRNRERSSPVATDPGTDVAPTTTDDEDDPATHLIESPRAASASPVRAETPHDFAPYSQLFTRLRHPS